MRGNAAVVAGQRIVRLLFLIGLAVAAYFALSILDHSARADEGPTDRLDNASAKRPTSDESAVKVEKNVEGKGTAESPKAAVQKARKLTSPATKRAVPTPKAADRKASASRLLQSSDAAKAPVRRSVAATSGKAPAVVAKTTKPLRKAQAVVANATEPLRTAPTAVAKVTEPLRTPPTVVAEASQPLTDAKRTMERDLPAPPARDALPSPPPPATAQPPAPATAFAVPMTQARPQVPGPSAGFIRCDDSRPHHASRHHGSGLTPVPANPPHPGDRTDCTAHPGDHGGGSPPPTGTVPSSAWPGIPAAATLSLADASTPGRSVRYSGPPS